MENNKSSDKEKDIQKIDKVINAGNKLVENSANVLQNVGNGVDKIGAKINNAKSLVNEVKNLGATYVESQKIKSETILGLKKIEEDHKTINNHINKEYSKQIKQMDKASDVVDAGLASNDIEKIREGLAAMTATANHNPMADLKKSLDKDLEQDYLDDDFIIEI